MKFLLILTVLPLGAICYPSALQPVQGLFIKKSEDGTSGDLYVAASEDNGSTTPWLSEKSVSILPSNLASTSQLEQPMSKQDQFDQQAFLKNNFFWPQHTVQQQEEEKPKVEVVVIDPSKFAKEDISVGAGFQQQGFNQPGFGMNPMGFGGNGMPYPFSPYGFPFPQPFFYPFFPQFPQMPQPSEKVPEQQQKNTAEP